jgi:hypothetical protein
MATLTFFARNHSKFSFVILALALLAGCTFTRTKTKDPVFNDKAKMEQELTRIVSAEHINLDGKEISTNGKTQSELEISITNGTNIPSNDDERKALGKLIGTTIKKNLKDLSEFDVYKVLFVTEVQTGASTKESWVGNTFTSSEL